MAKLASFKMDAEKEEAGVWVELNEGFALLIAGSDNAEYRKYRNKLLQPLVKKLRAKQLSADELEDLTMRAMARHVLLGWRNLEDDAGKPIPYSTAKALEVLRESRELFIMVGEIAADRELYRKECEEDAAKN